MIKTLLLAATLAGASLLMSGPAQATNFIVSYEGEAAGVQNTTATFTTSGVETFNNLPVHSYPESFTTNFGTSGANSTINGTYQAQGSQGILINSADQYGGAGGTGNYAVAFQNTPYSLTLTSNVPGGINYFGFWLSALDPGNFVTFYDANGKELFSFNPQDAINAVQNSADPSLYYGNPNPGYIGTDKGEPFIFLNFFDATGTFSKVVFSENRFGGGYESDNHTVGHYVSMGQGTRVSLLLSATPGAPELSTWTMMVFGFIGLGLVGNRTRRQKEIGSTDFMVGRSS